MTKTKKVAGRILVAGSSCLDITPVFPNVQHLTEPGDILSPGKLVRMAGVDIHAGGAVSNTGMAMKLLGAEVSLLTRTGLDEFGSIIKNIYEKQNIKSNIITVEGEQTSFSIILAMPGIDRIFLHDSGSNDTFCFEDVEHTDLNDFVLYHFGYPPLMKRMFVEDGKELHRMMQYVKAHNIVTSLDMASIDPSSEASQADWDKILTNVLPYIDIFAPSVEELCYMLDRERLDRWRARDGSKDIVRSISYDDILPLADRCMELGTKVLLIKCGEPGFFYQTAAQHVMKPLCSRLRLNIDDWSGRKGFENSYVPDCILSATGAGDTTIAAFLTAMLSGYSYDMCIHLAAAEGASCVTAYGALDGIKTLGELENKISEGWKKGTGLKKCGNRQEDGLC